MVGRHFVSFRSAPVSNISVLAGIGNDGSAYIQGVEGAVDGALFSDFVNQCYLINEGKNIIWLIDNASSHICRLFLGLAKQKGWRVVYNPHIRLNVRLLNSSSEQSRSD